MVVISFKSFSSLLSSLILVLAVMAGAAERALADIGSGQHMKGIDCPPGAQGPFANCEQYWEAINKEGLRLGYADSNGNGTADFLEYYKIHQHDCADVAAEVACVSQQSECIQQTAQQLRSRSAYHSTNMVEGIGECDFTPMLTRGGSQANKGQVGGGLARRRDTTIDSGAPDAGEQVDPAYTCAMNGADRRKLGGGGGGGGGMFGGSSIGTLAMISLLFRQSMNNQLTPIPTLSPVANSSGGSAGDGGSNNGTPTPVKTPKVEPTSQPTATSVPATPAIDGVKQEINGSVGVSIAAQPTVAASAAQVDSGSAWTENRGDIFGK